MSYPPPPPPQGGRRPGPPAPSTQPGSYGAAQAPTGPYAAGAPAPRQPSPWQQTPAPGPFAANRQDYRQWTQPQAAPQAVGSYAAPRWIMPSRWSAGPITASIVIVVICLVTFVISIEIISDGLQRIIDSANRRSSLDYPNSPKLMKGALLALVPAFVIGLIVWSIDRWEPEPAIVYVIALGWGGGVSILIAFFGNRWWSEMISQWQREFGWDGKTVQVLKIAVGAGVVEELAKGLGVLLVFFVLKKYVNGPLDGIVLGLLTGVGFAFTENILYFGRASIVEDFYEYAQQEIPKGSTVGWIFLMRAVLTPFIHPLATAITGLFVGMAATQRNQNACAVVFGFVGYVLAAFLHGLHNYSSVVGFASEPGQRILLQLPLYVGAGALIYTTARLQRRATLWGLGEYAAAGWVSRNEIAMVMSLSNRRQGRAWASASVAKRGGVPADGRRAMKRFQTELIQLGYSRSVNVDRRTAHTAPARRQEMEHLDLITRLRRVFAEVQKPPPAPPGSRPYPAGPPGQWPYGGVR